MTAVVVLVITAFLGIVTHALVWPALTVSASGVSGQMALGRPVDIAWEDVTIDVDDDAAPGTLRLDVGAESVSVSSRSWVGFGDFVWLVCVTPAAAVRLTPAARREVVRLLEIGR
ncbi:MAG: hypothetical protein ABJA74_03625 [Lapillicoccus sp.]